MDQAGFKIKAEVDGIVSQHHVILPLLYFSVFRKKL
jgi:hypothetical protein